MDIKTIWITLCKNEQDIIPFCIDYWKRIADKVIVYDNHSTDNSVELLSKEDFIEVRTFDSEGQNEFIQKEVKENAYQEFKNDYDIVVITDMDEVFYFDFDDFNAVASEMIAGGYNVLATPIYSLCETFKPQYEEGKYLHQLCNKFYKQRMNHINGYENYSKLSIFNTKITNEVRMSVGQHIVRTLPEMKILFSDRGFNLHLDKGFGIDYKYNIRKKMNDNLSKENRRNHFCYEYADSYEKLKRDYLENQRNSFNLNEKVG